MRVPVRLGVTAVASPLEVGAGDAPDLLSGITSALNSLEYNNLEIIPSNEPVVDPASATLVGRQFYDQRVDAVCVVAATWFEDYLILDLLEECNVPVVAWARPGMETGSLCGMQQISFFLNQLGRPYLYVFDDINSKKSLERTYQYALAAGLRRWLRRARIGWLGHRVEGMTDTTPHELALKKVFGPRVVGIDSQIFLQRVAEQEEQAAERHWQQVSQQVGNVIAGREAGIESMQVYAALKEMIHESGLSAVAIGCYPHLMGKVCLAISLLAEEGFPGACEGDVNGALAMVILNQLSGTPVHNTDTLDPVSADNALVFSHCGTGGFSLASSNAEITLGPVRLMDRGVVALFPARPGEVTLLNIVPSLDGYHMGVLYGQALETDMLFPDRLPGHSGMDRPAWVGPPLDGRLWRPAAATAGLFELCRLPVVVPGIIHWRAVIDDQRRYYRPGT
jgi:L-fucose isomerase-like protein